MKHSYCWLNSKPNSTNLTHLSQIHTLTRWPPHTHTLTETWWPSQTHTHRRTYSWDRFFLWSKVLTPGAKSTINPSSLITFTVASSIWPASNLVWTNKCRVNSHNSNNNLTMHQLFQQAYVQALSKLFLRIPLFPLSLSPCTWPLSCLQSLVQLETDGRPTRVEG